MEIVDQANAEHYLWQGDCQGWRLCDTPDLAVTREAMPAGRAETRHRHAGARQVFYCLAGRLVIETDPAQHELAPGQSLTVPPGVWHIVSAPEAAEFLVISAPTTRGDREDG